MPSYRKNSLRLKRSKTRTRNKSLKNKNKRKTVNKKRKISRKRKTQYGGSAATAEKMMLNIIRAYIHTTYGQPKSERSEKEGFMKIFPAPPLSSTFIADLCSYVKIMWSGIQLINDTKKNTVIKKIENSLNGKKIKNIGEIDGNNFIVEFKEKEKDIHFYLIFMTENRSENEILRVKLHNPQLDPRKLNLRDTGIIGPIDLFSYSLNK